MDGFDRDVCVIGGAGHVGLPLAMTLADSGQRVLIYDIDRNKVEKIRRGEMPFAEDDGAPTLQRVLQTGQLEVTSSPELLSSCRFLILIIGTPVDEHLNPGFAAIHRAIDRCEKFLRDGQVIILRSTVYPGISQHIQRYLRDKSLDISVAFCPERIAQGKSLRELRELPQIVSAFNGKTLDAVTRLFRTFCGETIAMEPMEAELCKLMTNSWRYIQFAAVNQFYMIATEHGLDFDRILHGCRHHYPRMAGMPGPGFAAGPCLAKDTMQLAAFSHNTFQLGHAAMLINEGLPAHLVQLAQQQIDLTSATAGILGLAFKADSDDSRDSLSYKLRKLLILEARQVLCHDPHVNDTGIVPLQELLEKSDVIFVATPHQAYRDLTIPPGKLAIDVWNIVRRGAYVPSRRGSDRARTAPQVKQ